MLRVILQQRRYEKGNLNKSGLGEKEKLVFFDLSPDLEERRWNTYAILALASIAHRILGFARHQTRISDPLREFLPDTLNGGKDEMSSIIWAGTILHPGGWMGICKRLIRTVKKKPVQNKDTHLWDFIRWMDLVNWVKKKGREEEEEQKKKEKEFWRKDWPQIDIALCVTGWKEYSCSERESPMDLPAWMFTKNEIPGVRPASRLWTCWNLFVAVRKWPESRSGIHVPYPSSQLLRRRKTFEKPPRENYTCFTG